MHALGYFQGYCIMTDEEPDFINAGAADSGVDDEDDGPSV